MTENRTLERIKIMLYVPNMMDVFRYALSVCSLFYCYNENKYKYIIFYALSILLDAFDGMAARYLNQTSRVGCCMDMVCDRVSVSFMYLMMARVYPAFEPLLIFSFVVDFASHYMQFISNAMMKTRSHKDVDESQNIIV